MGFCRENYKAAFSKKVFNKKHITVSPNDARHFQSSRLLPQTAYLIYRFVFMAYTIGVVSWSLSNMSDSLKEWPIYLTHWSYVIEVLYFLVSFSNAMYSFVKGFRYKVSYRNASGAIEMTGSPQKPSFLEKLQWSLFYIGTVCSCIVTLIFWFALYNPDDGLKAMDLNIHCFNSVIMVIDQFLVALPFALIQVVPVLTFGVSYLAFNISYWAWGSRTGDDHVVYSILNWNENPLKAVIYIIVIVLVLIPFFQTLHYLVCTTRETVHFYFISIDKSSVLPTSVSQPSDIIEMHLGANTTETKDSKGAQS
eukprot:Nk52_evm50s1810 gene=Nk52_evmTU50s1810